jgi:hypothetical protein
MEKPNIELAGRKIAEKSAMEVMDQIVKPYAEYYAVTKGGAVGEVLKPFIAELVDYLKEEVIDRIDGEDNI